MNRPQSLSTIRLYKKEEDAQQFIELKSPFRVIYFDRFNTSQTIDQELRDGLANILLSKGLTVNTLLDA